MADAKKVSFSQLSMYNDCPYKWYLSYVKNLKTGTGNIHTIFGTGMHATLQLYLQVMFNDSIKVADELDCGAILKEEMFKAFNESKSKLPEGEFPCTKEDLMEFYQDGMNIIEFFKKNRGDYFSRKGYELLGVEIPLEKEIGRKVVFQGYIDVVIKDSISGKVKIIDFKTSTRGWKDYQKNDANKVSQVILYKKFYSDTLSISQDKIDVEFIILKRKLYEKADYPQKRIQRFTPASGSVTVGRAMSSLNEFVNNCFTEEGEHVDKVYPKRPDRKCDFCEFNNTIHCDKKN